MYRLVRILQPALAVLAVFCLVPLRPSVLACGHNTTNDATNVTVTFEIRTFELGSQVTLCCGNGNLSSSTLLSWSKDENVLVNITSNNSTLVLSNLEAEDSGLYLCMANSTKILKSVQLNMRTNGDDGAGEEEEEVEEGEAGLTNVDYIAIALGLGLTTFILVSMAVLLYKAEKRRIHDRNMKRWRVIVKGSENLAVDEDIMTKPVSSTDFHFENGLRPGNKHAPSNRLPAGDRWSEALGHENEANNGRNSPGGSMWFETLDRENEVNDGRNSPAGSMWQINAYV